ncbi:DNA-directed RNA polymerases I II III subunit 10 [Colletotrichum graminicola]|nr:DNA-directed RNA polymerases I II III subunit 10 [Colletotrichum graminicola]
MIIPVRCFSCGKVTGDLWERYLKLIDDGITDGSVACAHFPILGPSILTCIAIAMRWISWASSVIAVVAWS